MSSARAERVPLRPVGGEAVEDEVAAARRPHRLSRPAVSIRLRLSLLYSAILALTLLLLGGVLYVKVDQAMVDIAKTTLKAEAQSLDPDLLLHAPRNPSADPDHLIVAGLAIQIRSLDGKVLLPSPAPEGAVGALTPSMLAQLQQPGSTIDPVIVSIGGQRALLYSRNSFRQNWAPGRAPGSSYGPGGPGGGPGGPGGGPGGPGGGPGGPGGPGSSPLILQVAHSLADQDATLGVLRLVLIGGGFIATLLAFGAGWLLAGTALRPIARITQTARAIGDARDFDRRVTHSGPRDEVGRLATTFNAMLASLQEAYQTQRRFVADASHELRTPLTTIRGNLGLLERDPPIADDDRRAVLADLVGESERLSRLVADLLTLARTDAGRPLRHEPVPVSPLLADLCRRLGRSHPGRRIHREVANDVAVLGDPDALTQVLLIVLDNALKFTPPGGVVGVATTMADERVFIAVRDSGPGIAPEALPHIFERFYQGDAARTETGTGLGLAIAKALVETLHGDIRAESMPGRGSTFTLILPPAHVPTPSTPLGTTAP